MDRRRFLRRAILLCLVVVAVCAAILLGGCASTDTGRKAELGGTADLGSTGLALANGANEANPLGWGALAVKQLLVKHGDALPCPERREWHRAGAAVNWGFAGWNAGQLVAVTVGAGGIGVVAAGMVSAVGLSQWAARDFDDLPPCALPDRAWDEDPSCNIADCWSLDLWPSEIAQLEQYEWEHY